VTAKEIAVKKYVVKLTDEERERLDTVIRGGKHSAQMLTKARIPWKASASEAWENGRNQHHAKPNGSSPRLMPASN
jgi:hypothetical protein